MKISVFFFFLTLLASQNLWSADLDNKQLFYRCYQHLTQQFPESDNPALLKVINDNKDAIDACMEDVFDRAALGSNGMINNVNDPIAIAVINNFQNLHNSWFKRKTMPTLAVGRYSSLPPLDLYETSLAANYITRSLFDNSIPASYILTADHHLKAKRSLGIPAFTDFYANAYISTASDHYFNDPSIYIERGKIIGFNPVTGQNNILLPYSYTRQNHLGNLQTTNDAMPVFAHYGAGAAGSIPYIAMSVDEDFTYKIDGGIEIPRKWAEAVFKDFLCRDLPLVRSEDVTSLVNINNDLPFRKYNSCTRCHASMDQLTGVIRGYEVKEVRHYSYNSSTDKNDLKAGMWRFALKYSNKDPRLGTATPPQSPFPPPQPIGADPWPATIDPDYQNRPSSGKIFFRAYNGTLVDENISSVEDFGIKISKHLDPYLCLTKRYYHYFTGIDVDINDPDPAEGRGLASQDTQRQKLLQFTQNFAGTPIGSGNQSLRSLIESIMKHPDYKKSDYGVQP